MSTTQIRFAPAIDSMRDFLKPHRSWLEGVVGCSLEETLTFEIELPLGQIVLRELLIGTALDDSDSAPEAEVFRAEIERWELAPGLSPRIRLVPSRKRWTPITKREKAWHAEWGECPVAMWLRGLPSACVSVIVPYVSFSRGLFPEWQHWLIVNRAQTSETLNRIARLVVKPGKQLRVLGEKSQRLPQNGYDWESVVLDPDLTRLVRDDFEMFFQREQWFRQHKLPFRRGYLYHGPPGNGKTSVVRVMASHPAVTAFTLDFFSEQNANSALTALFDSAIQAAPALLIFEDLDRVFPRGHERDPRIQVSLQHFLNCLDGVGTQDGSIVVATANDASVLDPAIVSRPGRFDRVMAFRAPCSLLRTEYFRRLSGGALDEKSLESAVQESEGFSFAQLRESYILAGQLAFQRDDLVANMDLIAGVRTVRSGRHGIQEDSRQAAGFRCPVVSV